MEFLVCILFHDVHAHLSVYSLYLENAVCFLPIGHIALNTIVTTVNMRKC